jgi:hypothetical protein
LKAGATAPWGALEIFLLGVQGGPRSSLKKDELVISFLSCGQGPRTSSTCTRSRAIVARGGVVLDTKGRIGDHKVRARSPSSRATSICAVELAMTAQQPEIPVLLTGLCGTRGTSSSPLTAPHEPESAPDRSIEPDLMHVEGKFAEVRQLGGEQVLMFSRR